MKPERFIKIGKLTALFSFLIGSIIFIHYLITSSSKFFLVSYWFLIVAGAVNLIILGVVIFHAFNQKQERKKFLITGGVMLLNIPITLFYMYIVLILLNTMRISLVNTTGNELTDIHITGCESKKIDHLKKGEKKTVWISINNDCAININYIVDEIRVNEQITGYVCQMMGHKMKYNIGMQNNPDHRSWENQSVEQY